MFDEEQDYQPPKPSAKALGKRKVVEPEPEAAGQFEVDDMYFSKDQPFSSGHDPEYDDESDREHSVFHPKVNFVYDAVAERTRLRQLQEGHQLIATNGIH